MQIGVLGPLEVRTGSTTLEVSGGRLRALLVALALAAPRAASSTALVDALWGDDPPADPGNALQSLVSRLRRALHDSEVVQQSGSGYRLSIEPDELDAHRFKSLAEQGRASLRAGNPRQAATDFDDALALWRGDPLDGVEGADADIIRTGLIELRLQVIADRTQAKLDEGHAADVLVDLEALTKEHPLNEWYAELQIKALHQAGRSAEALASFERTRSRLADELGTDPSPALQAAHLAVLRGDQPATPIDKDKDEPARSNLRATLTSFVGRDEQLVQISNLLSTNRLVTLVGPGGAGKTRLATAAAANQSGAGVWVAELAPVTDPADVPQAVLGALGLRDAILIDRAAVTSQRDSISRLIGALANRNALIVLDNCEHLIDASAQLADTLLAECADLRIIATSREPLAIFGEALVAIPPLEMPAPDTGAKEALKYAAVQLFADRARDVRPDFEVDDDTVRSVVEIVRRLDGLPLAIELAAARLRTLQVKEIERRLEDRFKLLTGGSRTAMPRHRTLHAVVEWSWDLLTDDEKLLTQRLAVFAGGISPEAAAAVSQETDADIDDLLMSLVDKSLLQIAKTTGTTPRYRMLETIREFGMEQMAASGEVAQTRLAHATYFKALVDEADQYVRTAQQLQWLQLLEAERDNVLAALKYFGDVGRGQDVMDLVGKLGWHWMTNGNHGDIVTWVSFALSVEGDVDPLDRLVAEAFLAVNTVAWNVRVATDEIEAGLARLKDLSVEVTALVDSGEAPPMMYLLAPIIAMFSDDIPTAERLTETAMDHEDPWLSAAIRTFRAAIAENTGDVARMRVDGEIALARFRELGERWGLANSLQLIGQIELMEGNIEAAAAAYEEALEHAITIGSSEDVATMRLRLADILTRLGDIEGAKRHAVLGRAAADMSGTPGEALFMSMIEVEIARAQGEHDLAKQLCDQTMEVMRGFPYVHPIKSHGIAVILASAAKIELDLGHGPEQAWTYIDESYQHAIESKDMPIVANAAVSVAILVSAAGQHEQAAEVLGAAAQIRGAEDLSQLDIVRLNEQLGGLHDGPYAEAYARGRAMTREAAIARTDPARAR